MASGLEPCLHPRAVVLRQSDAVMERAGRPARYSISCAWKRKPPQCGGQGTSASWKRACTRHVGLERVPVLDGRGLVGHPRTDLRDRGQVAK